MLRFDDVITRAIMSALKRLASSLSVSNRLRRNIWLFLFSKRNLLTQTLRPVQQ